MSTPAITYRSITGPNNEPNWGQGQGNYISDVDAVGQAIRTRLLLFEGEWWSDLADGLPLWQSILGQGGNAQQQIALLIQRRILGTPFVTGLTSVQFSYTPSTRAYQFSAVVQTQFGNVLVTNNIPSPPRQELP